MLRISLTGISARQLLCKNGLPMYLSSVFSVGGSVISLLYSDMNTNEIISYDLSQSANMEQIQRMLAGAFTKFPSVDGLIFHSDQGWQYQHVYFRQALKDHKIIQSMSRKGNCYDNCIMETILWTDEKRDVLRA